MRELAEEAGLAQEDLLTKHRDRLIEIRRLESEIVGLKGILVTIENALDFSTSCKEIEGKATGRLRLPDGSYQLTKTAYSKETTQVDVDEALSHREVRKALDRYIKMVPVLDIDAACADPEGANILAPFTSTTTKEVIKITPTFNPK